MPEPPVDSSAPVPDPFDDVEALGKLEQEITTLAAHIHAATHRLLTLLADFDRRRGWELGGHRSCAHWLSFSTGIDLGTAREKVRTARALVGLPETSASMGRGELSFSKVRALTRVATGTNEGQLLEVARECTTAQLEREVRSFRRGNRKEEAELERERFENRSLSVFPDYEGMYVVRGRLPAEVGALLMRAIEAAGDALFREKGEQDAGKDSVRAAAQRRADALGLLAERALGAGFVVDETGNEALAGDPEDDDSSDTGAGRGEGEGDEHGQASAEPRAGKGAEGGKRNAGRPLIPISGCRARRYEVLLHVEAETLRVDGEGGRSELEDGTRVSSETSQRLCCDAGVVRVRHGADGSILDVGRRTRTIPPALRRALEIRDGGCRFPGCGLPFTEGHHITHWADGGETSLENCVLLCRYHHRLMHEGGWTMSWKAKDKLAFFDPRGRAHGDRGGKVPPVDGETGLSLGSCEDQVPPLNRARSSALPGL
jgi:hypothetical protein